jgi:hypothetical protein
MAWKALNEYDGKRLDQPDARGAGQSDDSFAGIIRIRFDGYVSQPGEGHPVSHDGNGSIDRDAVVSISEAGLAVKKWIGSVAGVTAFIDSLWSAAAPT